MHGSPSLAQLSCLLTLPVAAWLLAQVLPAYHLYVGNVLAMYVVLAIGLDLLIGRTGLFAFSHIAFFGIGIYATVLLKTTLALPFFISMPLAALFTASIGCLIALASIRLRDIYLALATFAFAEAAHWAFNNAEPVTGGAAGLNIPPERLFGYVVDSDKAAFPLVIAVLAMIVGVTICITRSKLSREMSAVRESEHVAIASGVNVTRVKVTAFVISAMYASVAGSMFTLFQSFVNADTAGFSMVVLTLSMIVVGGMGTLPGAIIGAVLLGIIPEFMRAFMRDLLIWQELVYGLILILCMMFMPRGIWGFVRRSRSFLVRRPCATDRATADRPVVERA